VGIGTVDGKLGELTGHVRTSRSRNGSAKGHTLTAVPGGEVRRALNQLISYAAPVHIKADFADHDPQVAYFSPPR
jgi:hypothetical protein